MSRTNPSTALAPLKPLIFNSIFPPAIFAKSPAACPQNCAISFDFAWMSAIIFASGVPAFAPRASAFTNSLSIDLVAWFIFHAIQPKLPFIRAD